MQSIIEGEKLRIKAACTKDYITLAKLSKATFIETYAKFNSDKNLQKYSKANFSRNAIKNQLEDAGNFFLVAIFDDKEVGYAKLTENNKPFHDKTINAVELERIYVLKEYQGLGIGKNLLENCLAFAKLRKYPVMWLGVWEQNLDAIKFYQRQGFVVFGSCVFQLGDDDQNDFLMKKEI